MLVEGGLDAIRAGLTSAVVAPIAELDGPPHRRRLIAGVIGPCVASFGIGLVAVPLAQRADVTAERGVVGAVGFDGGEEIDEVLLEPGR